MLPCFPLHLHEEKVTQKQSLLSTKTIRHAIKDDISRIAEIDKECFTPSLTEDKINEYFSNLSMSIIWKVFVLNGDVIGYSFYELRNFDVRLFRIAFTSKYRRKGYGTQLLKDVYRSLTCVRNKIVCSVGEKMDNTIRFFSKMNFIATCVKRGNCADGTDTYSFRLVLPESLLVKNIEDK